jgi:hypothetical protein
MGGPMDKTRDPILRAFVSSQFDGNELNAADARRRKPRHCDLVGRHILYRQLFKTRHAGKVVVRDMDGKQISKLEETDISRLTASGCGRRQYRSRLIPATAGGLFMA